MVSRALYRALVHLHPRGFRDRFEDEMLAVYDDAMASRGAAGLIASTLVSLVGQWLRPSRANGIAVSAATMRAFEICRTRQRLEIVDRMRPLLAVAVAPLFLTSVRSQLDIIAALAGAWFCVVLAHTMWTRVRSPQEYERARLRSPGLREELAAKVRTHDIRQRYHGGNLRLWIALLVLAIAFGVVPSQRQWDDVSAKLILLCGLGLSLDSLRQHLARTLRRELNA